LGAILTRTHGGNLILVSLHALVEGPAVFRADKRFWRTQAPGHVRHIEPVSVYHVVEVATALFPETEAMNALNGIMSEGLKFFAIRTGTVLH
jgi:hypothetical protein